MTEPQTFKVNQKGIGKCFRVRREKLGLSLKEVAERSEIVSSHIWNIEQGRKEMSLLVFCSICSALNLPVSEVISNHLPAIENSVESPLGKRNQSLTGIQSSAIRIELIRRGVGVAWLAEKIGISNRSLSNQLALSCKTSSPARLKIEDVLQTPFWSSAEEFQRRQQLKRSLGVDPYTLNHSELRNLARRKRISMVSIQRTRKAVLSVLLDYANRQKNKNDK